MSAWSDGWTRVARFALLSVRRMGEEEFGSDAARRLLAGCALHADLSPEAVLGGFFAWVLCGLGQDVGWPVPEGGSGQLTAALVARLRARGGEVVCDAPVDRIVIRDRRAVAVRTRGEEIAATRAVLADVGAPRCTSISWAPSTFRHACVDDVRRFEWDNGTVKVDWNLDAPIPWSSERGPARGHAAPRRRASTRSPSRARRSRAAWCRPPFLDHGSAVDDRPDAHAGGRGDGVGVHPRAARDPRRRGRRPRSSRSIGPGLERIADRMEREIESSRPASVRRVRGRHVMGPADLEAAQRRTSPAARSARERRSSTSSSCSARFPASAGRRRRSAACTSRRRARTPVAACTARAVRTRRGSRSVTTDFGGWPFRSAANRDSMPP